MRSCFRSFMIVMIAIIVAAGLSSCVQSSKSSTPSTDLIRVERDAIIALICGSEPEAGCLPRICEQVDKCAVVQALSNKAVFDFVANYSACQGCATPDFPPERGIGKCVEYQVSESVVGWVVTFWVSEGCSFRYGRPSESQINVSINSQTLAVEGINPDAAYLQDPLYCQTNSDCLLLSGSGVPVMGCNNYFYAPLHWSGYYPNQNCSCVANQCREK